MTKKALLYATMAVALLAAAAADAMPPTPAAGTLEIVDLSITPISVAGRNEQYHIVATATLSGTFGGSLESDSIEMLHPTGNSTIRSTETCQCTVEGRSGTVVFATVARITGDPFFYEDKKTVVSATGGLAGLRATMSVRWDGAVATYTGSYQLAP